MKNKFSVIGLISLIIVLSLCSFTSVNIESIRTMDKEPIEKWCFNVTANLSGSQWVDCEDCELKHAYLDTSEYSSCSSEE